MTFQADSHKAQETLRFLDQLQHFFVEKLQKVANVLGEDIQFTPVHWLRDQGIHGGGVRFVAAVGLLNSASINLSQLNFANMPDKAILSATALSAIIHPAHPLAPSMHLHISWTEYKNGHSFWRIMADLNPSISNAEDKIRFEDNLKAISGNYYESGCQLGDDYFYIPALQRFRGVSHFYLEDFNDDSENMAQFPQRFGQSVIDCYCAILQQRLLNAPQPNEQQNALQLNYNTLYFYQVLTLDKGTTAGLLAHNQNDLGILGSLPAHINISLLTSWLDKTAQPQYKLIKRLLSILPNTETCQITAELKAEIAQQIRLHYAQYPLH
ncbi:MAG: coproporphyrinogen III oxidase [Psychromonas sp.]|jgi:coproporphyrinogen III oxidase|uniref:coproporphyrinogen III oxidase n=1 Tax=Psychromonas sp. TaxID=1884585 RepID=UPI0039E41E6B